MSASLPHINLTFIGQGLVSVFMCLFRNVTWSVGIEETSSVPPGAVVKVKCSDNNRAHKSTKVHRENDQIKWL